MRQQEEHHDEAPQYAAPAVAPAPAEQPRHEEPAPVSHYAAEEPRYEAPRAEAPRVEAPRVEAPRAEAPRVEAPRPETPKIDSKALLESAGLVMVETDRAKAPSQPVEEAPQQQAAGRPRRERPKVQDSEELVQIETGPKK